MDPQSSTAAAANTRRAKERAGQQQTLIGAIDQGTSSTRFLVFENLTGQLISSSQIEIQRIVPKEGWVEIDPNLIIESVYKTIENVYSHLDEQFNNIECIGICNQRESTVVWDSKTGKALYNVIVWMDNRTKDIVDQMIDNVPGRDFNFLKDKTGLPMSTYFSAFKLKWLIDNVKEVSEALEAGRLLFGTVDSWILFNLTGQHLTDVTNASRTFLMNIETLNWDESLCNYFNVPRKILPKILASADNFGSILHGPLKDLPITGVIGDQSAALFGHNCLQLGQTKATFGTGCFIMQNIGAGPLSKALSGVQRSAKRGLITTVGYKLKGRAACYALEGSIKIAGAALTWMRDNMQLICNYDECDELVNRTTNSAGVFFVPALGGLYSPYWDPNAAGLYIGLSQFSRREHLIRATFDSIAFQTNDILSLMRGVTNGLMIDGGLVKSDNMCQILADITGCDIVRPSMCETSALGAAMVAGCGADLWSYEDMLANSSSQLYEYSSSLNQNHHYPLESLYYEEKFSSIIQSRAQERREIQLFASNQKHQAIRTSACNLDAGGGVNDDAGGGTRGPQEDCVGAKNGRSSGLASGGAGSSSSGSGSGNSNKPASSTGVSSDAEDEVESELDESDECNCVTTSGEFTANESDAACGQELAALMPLAEEEFTSCERGSELLGLAKDASSFAFYQTPSSGYNSGSDNFERLTSTSGCTDSHQTLMTVMRRDSPTTSSQASQEAGQDCWLAANNSNDKPIDESSRLSGQQQPPRRQQQQRAPESSHQAPAGDVRPVASALLPFRLLGGLLELLKIGSDKAAADKKLEEEERGKRSSKQDEHIDEFYLNQCFCDQQRAAERRALQAGARTQRPVDVFQSYISLEHRTELVGTWRRAVERSMHWTRVHHEEVRRIDYQRLSSLPISMYLFFSIGMAAFSNFLSSGAATG